MRLLLVRHGESVWNLEHRLQGQTMDVPLTDRGLAQAAGAAERVKSLVGGDVGMGEVVLVSSDQLRAVQTAGQIASVLGVRPLLTELAREQALGELEGRFTDELSAEPVPDGVDISEVRWGGGESIAMVHARCRVLVDFLRDLARDLSRRSRNIPSVAKYPERRDGEGEHLTIVLVSHGDLIRVLLTVLAGRGHREVGWRPIGNCEVIEAVLPGASDAVEAGAAVDTRTTTPERSR